MSSFYTALSGLNAYNTEISTISNNVANMETAGYKSTSVSFAEALSSAITGSSTNSVGNGVQVESNNVNWTQGDLTETGDTYDLAISGSGFFVVTDSGGNNYYTRDGSFSKNDDNQLLNSDGLVLQGYVIDSSGSLGSLQDIDLSSFETQAATATTSISTTLNLESSAEIGDTYTATVTCYDSLGNEVPISITLAKTTDNSWSWSASIDSSDGSTSSSGTLTFNSDGTLENGTDPTITLTLTNGSTATQTITWDIYDSDGDTNGSLTQYASNSTLSDSSQNGGAAGTLTGISIDSSGVITGTYSNNETTTLYQIALATFSDTDGLQLTTNGCYESTATSGTANLGVADTGEYGTISSGYLESANVDLSEEMTKMIIAQQAYEACSKLISTEQDMLQKMLNEI